MPGIQATNEQIFFQETVTVDTDITTIAEVVLSGIQNRIALEVLNGGAIALDDFVMSVQLFNAEEYGDTPVWHTLVQGAAWDVPTDDTEPVLKCLSTRIDTLGAGLSSAAALYLAAPVYRVRFAASVGSSTAAVTVTGRAGRW